MYRVISHREPVKLIAQEDGTIWFFSPNDPALVAALKGTIPHEDRKPIYERGQFSHWAIAPQWAETLATLAEKHGMGRPEVPELPEADPWDSVGG